MKVYLVSLGLGLLVGVIYALFNVRSPAPPVIALVGLLGILAGEQIPPLVKRLLADEPARAIDWTQNEPVILRKSAGPRVQARYPSCLDAEGRFRIADVPAGRYEFVAAINGPPSPSRPGTGPEIGRAALSVVVPEAEEAGAAPPFDLGEVSFHLGWTFHRAGPNRSHAPRSVMTVIYMDRDMRLKAPENHMQQADWDTWCTGATVGEIIDTPNNPVLFERAP